MIRRPLVPLLLVLSGAAGYAQQSGTTGHEAEEPGSDETGFHALPGGLRVFHNGAFVEMTRRASWWSSTPDGQYVMRRALFHDKSGIDRDAATRTNAFSVRCIED